MIIESKVYQLLINDDELNTMLNDMRGGPFGDLQQGIFVDDVPEIYKKTDEAPFMRINPISLSDGQFADDEALYIEHRAIIEFWCESLSQTDSIRTRIDEILKENNFYKYTTGEKPRYKDNDIGLWMNTVKYRFFEYKN